jgi:hypothetical protein
MPFLDAGKYVKLRISCSKADRQAPRTPSAGHLSALQSQKCSVLFQLGLMVLRADCLSRITLDSLADPA